MILNSRGSKTTKDNVNSHISAAQLVTTVFIWNLIVRGLFPFTETKLFMVMISLPKPEN